MGYTAWNCAERSLPCGWQAVVFPASLATDNLGPVCPQGDQTRYSLPFVRLPLVFVSYGDSIAQAAVQWTSAVGRGFVLTKGPWRLSMCRWGFYSHYFLATKRTGGFHPIFNLRGLHWFFRVAKFCMETLTSILQDLHKGWWVLSLDLCMCRYIPVIGGIFGLLSGIRPRAGSV